MDGVNIYLGVAVALFLAGVGIKALGVDPGQPRTTKVRAVLFVLAVGFAVAAYLAPLPGTAKYDRQQAEQSYQRQVLAACADYKTAVHAGDNFSGRDDQGQFVRDSLVRFMTSQLSAERATLNALWRKNPPSELQEPAQRARQLADRGLAIYSQVIDRIRQLPPTFGQDELDSVDAEFSQVDSLGPEFSSAMSELAGESCALR